MLNHVEKVTLEIELSNGDFHKYVVDKPAPSGGNPRFMAQQLAAALAEVGRRGDDMLENYAAQIRGEACSRPPGVVDETCAHCGQPRAAHAQAWVGSA